MGAKGRREKCFHFSKGEEDTEHQRPWPESLFRAEREKKGNRHKPYLCRKRQPPLSPPRGAKRRKKWDAERRHESGGRGRGFISPTKKADRGPILRGEKDPKEFPAPERKKKK